MTYREISLITKKVESTPEKKSGVFGVIKCELRSSCAVEAVIGHMKTVGQLGRCHLKGGEGHAAKFVLTAVRPQPPTRAGLAQGPQSNRAPAGFRNPVNTQIGFLADD